MNTTTDIGKLLKKGLAAFMEGRLEDAESIYSEARLHWPDNVDVWHLSAILAHAQRDLGSARSFIKNSISIDPTFPAAHNTAGNISKDMGDINAALEHFSEALALNPKLAEAHANRSDVLRLLKKTDEAIKSAHQAIELDPVLPEAYANLGAAQIDVDDFEGALETLKKAITLAPDNPLNFVNLTKVQISLGLFESALSSAETAIDNAPELPQAGNALGNAYYALNQFKEAETAYKKAMRYSPSDPELLGNLGNAIARQHRLAEAEALLRESLKISPGDPTILTNLGGVLLQAGNFESSQNSFDKALELKPDLPDAHWNRGLLRLLNGDYLTGFKDYEHRWLLPEFKKRHTEIRPWQGENLSGKSILIYSEQGFGDTFQFIRYATPLAERGAKVYLETHMSLKHFLESSDVLEGVYGRGQPIPETDYQIPILGLPYQMATTLDNIPADVPYLPIPPGMVIDRDGNGDFIIGIAWAGRPTHKNDANRSILPSFLKPLFELQGIDWVSLQIDERHDDAIDLGLPIKDLRPQIDNFADTAATIVELDLVITVDTAVAHLAGGLGKDVWVMLPFVPDWRWLLDREDNPWYPSARLFRQQSPGDWDPVIRRVAKALQDRLS